MGINNVHHASETLAVCKEVFTIKQEIAVNQVTNDHNTSEILPFLGKKKKKAKFFSGIKISVTLYPSPLSQTCKVIFYRNAFNW